MGVTPIKRRYLIAIIVLIIYVFQSPVFTTYFGAGGVILTGLMRISPSMR